MCIQSNNADAIVKIKENYHTINGITAEQVREVTLEAKRQAHQHINKPYPEKTTAAGDVVGVGQKHSQSL